MELKAEKTTKNIRKSRFDPTVEFAKDDGIEIGELVKKNGFEIEVDWSEVPNWLIARLDDRIVGCVQRHWIYSFT